MFKYRPTRRGFSFFSVYFTAAIDNLGWSIVFPIFAPFFLDATHNLFSPTLSVVTRTTILGLFLAAFPLAQFFGAPLLGDLADRFGRKKAFLLSVGLCTLGYALSAMAIFEKKLILLFIARLISGLFSGNLSICLATIADLSSDEKTKVKHFSFLSVLGGVSFILGTYLGGRFSDATVHHSFSYDLPLWIATGLGCINVIFILFGFTETFACHKVPLHALGAIANIRNALQIKKLKSMYLIYFFFIASWNIILQFIPVHVIRYFQFTSSQIGVLSACMGLGWVIGSGVLSPLLCKKFSHLKILEIALIVFTYFCALIAVPDHLPALLFLLACTVIVAGVAWPLSTSIISNLAPREIQGKVLGMSQSMQSLATTISPILGGLSDELYARMTFFVAAFLSLIAALIYFRISVKVD